MTRAVGDSIRYMIGKPEKKIPVERPAEKKTDQEIEKDSPRQPITDQRTALRRIARSSAEIMEIDPPGGGTAEACRRRLLGSKLS